MTLQKVRVSLDKAIYSLVFNCLSKYKFWLSDLRRFRTDMYMSIPQMTAAAASTTTTLQ